MIIFSDWWSSTVSSATKKTVFESGKMSKGWPQIKLIWILIIWWVEWWPYICLRAFEEFWDQLTMHKTLRFNPFLFEHCWLSVHHQVRYHWGWESTWDSRYSRNSAYPSKTEKRSKTISEQSNKLLAIAYRFVCMQNFDCKEKFQRFRNLIIESFRRDPDDFRIT